VLTVAPTVAPAFTSRTTAGFTAGTAGSFTITTTGSPAASISTSSSLPNGLTFQDNGDGTATIFGTPVDGGVPVGGTYTVDLTAANGIGRNATQVLIVTVLEAPTLGGATSGTFYVGTAHNVVITTSPNSPPNTARLTETGKLPSGLKFTDNGNGTASITGTAAPNTGGGYTLTVSARNTGGAATETFLLQVDQQSGFVSSKNKTITTGTATFVSGVFNYLPIQTFGYPAPALSEVGTLPDGVVFKDHGDGTASLFGIPQVGTGGVYTVTFVAGNGVNTLPTDEKFILTVDDAVNFTSASNSYVNNGGGYFGGGVSSVFTFGQTGLFLVTTVGFPIPQILESGTLPAGLSFVDNHNGTATLSGTPSASGTWVLTFTAKNKTQIVQQTFTLVVQP
jgi:hypothetical protein